ncbi:hypothetical protein K2173_004442 [Erythroxylum novogranatense]|uniref:Uncharacterized protein n=1 Tax=Erythroxylum novogranatense TaxID=1862640 RepID=A0AAV8T4G4_9ROSI|nr:hypothetical protein K2173_004442 [Erythroxylum novogranatense]
MSPPRRRSKKRIAELVIGNSESKFCIQDGVDIDVDLSSDIKGIMSALHQIRERAQKNGQKKNEETIFSVASEIKLMIADLKSKIEKERQSFAKALLKSSKECENCLKNETAKLKEKYEKFCEDKEAHLVGLKDIVGKFEEDKERMLMRYEQLRKKEKSMISEHEKAYADRIANLKESLSKRKQDDKTFSILRKTVGCFLENASDEDFPPDD